MALDLRLQQKMSQQLVMTPQLQQAIKLLQLNHLELSEVLAKEMEENPMLEDGQGEERTEEIERLDGIEETVAAPSADSEKPGAEGDNQTASDLQSVLDAPVDATPEPTSKEKEKEIDWESYLESNTYALPATAGGQDELPPFEASLTKSESLHDHLRWQVQMGDFNEHEMAIAAMLIEEINDDGYLTADAVDIVCDEMELDADEVLSVLRMIQQFDPRGVGARNLRECLLLQVEELADEQPLMVDIIDRHLPNVEKRNYQAIVKDLKVTLPEVGEALKAIGQLEPRPGRLYSDQEPRYITPDIYVVRVGDGYEILLNEDGLPKLKISNYYRDALQNSNGKEKNFIQDKLRGAVWLIRSIHMRQRTIYKVVESILKFQADFFEKGVAHLKPLILKDVAEDVGMHESTISRVTSNKYVHCPQGTYELKYFFNSSIARSGGESIASESVRDRIKTIISEEDPSSPVSDQQIVKILKGHDINIARRTVAKYREMLKIPPSSKRKKVF
ncbi:MAG: RNA polymerase factor sigma-54 [Myxococcota bacterium]